VDKLVVFIFNKTLDVLSLKKESLNSSETSKITQYDIPEGLNHLYKYNQKFAKWDRKASM
jgi:hypothetical protein